MIRHWKAFSCMIKFISALNLAFIQEPINVLCLALTPLYNMMIFCRRLSNSSSIQSLPRPPSSLGFFRNLSGESLNTSQSESPRNNRFLGKFSFVLHSFFNYNEATTEIFLEECVTLLAYGTLSDFANFSYFYYRYIFYHICL